MQVEEAAAVVSAILLLAVERSNDVDLDPAWAEGAVAYAGISYGWRGLQVSAEVEKATLTSIGFRIGKRF